MSLDHGPFARYRGVMFPQQLAASGVQCEDLAPGARDEHLAVDDDGGRFLAAVGGTRNCAMPLTAVPAN